MQLTKKQIIIFVAVLLIIIVGIFLFLKSKNKVTSPNNPQQNQEEKKLPVNEEDKNFNSKEFEANARIDENSLILSTSKNFIERYGSWSNQSEDFFELTSNMMTDRMYNKAGIYINSNENFKNKDGYYGITTKLINAEIIESDANSAEVSLQLQQTEAKDNQENTFYKQAQLSLVFSNNKWLADSVIWK